MGKLILKTLPLNQYNFESLSDKKWNKNDKKKKKTIVQLDYGKKFTTNFYN